MMESDLNMKPQKNTMSKKAQLEMYKDYLFGKALRLEQEGTFYTLEEAKAMIASR